MEVDKDDAGQHSLGSQHQALRNLKSVNFNSVFTKYIENLCVKKILLQCSSKSLDTDAFVGVCFGFFLSTFGKSTKRTPIQSVMKRITIAERAPATCSDTKTKVYGRIVWEMRGKPAEDLPKAELMSGWTELMSDCEWNRGIVSESLPTHLLCDGASLNNGNVRINR